MKVFVDGSNIAFLSAFVAEKYANAEQAFPRIYSMVTGKIKSMFPYHEMIFAWEGKDSIKNRLEIFPEYKQQRVKDPSKAYCMPLAQKLNDKNGWVNIAIEGIEADDVIYALANIYKDTADQNVIISSDQDFIQCLQENLVSKVYAYQQKKYQETPDYDIVMYKCLTGDSSDNIPGVKGCGPKTALKYLKSGIPEKHQETVDKFFKIVSMKDYSEKFNTIERVEDFLEEIGI